MLKSFENYLRYSERSENTIKNYLADINQFARTNNIETAGYEQVISWLQGFDKPATKNRKLTSLKTFYEWAVDNKGFAANPAAKIDAVKVRNRRENYVTRDDYAESKKSVDRNYKYAARDVMIIDLLYNCGLRVFELSNIKMSDIDFNNQSINIIGKGNKPATIFLNDNAMNSLNKWVEQRSEIGKDSNYLLVTKTSDKMSVRGIQKMIEKYSGTHCHAFRHGFASTLINERNVSLPVVQKLMRHSNAQTTARYIHVNDDAQRAAVNLI